MGIKKVFGLQTLFIRFIVTLMIGMCLSIIVPLGLFIMTSKLGYTSYPNAGEQAAEKIILKIRDSQRFDPIWLSSQNKYLRLNKNFAVIGSSMNEKLALEAIQAVKAGELTSGPFMQIRLGTDYLILSYDIKSAYKNDYLNKYFPSPDLLLISIVGICLLVTVVLSIRKYTRILSKGLIPINRAVKTIQNNELDFTVGMSNISEFNAVLGSFQELINSLRETLENKWAIEERQRYQITALVHDIKTPLTGVIGWTDLMHETQLTSEQDLYLKKLHASSETIEQLVNALMQVSLNGKEVIHNPQDINLFDLIYQIEKNLRPMIDVKRISFETIFEVDSAHLKLDAILFNQALSNIIANAVDFANLKGKIKLFVKKSKKTLCIVIEDDGPGFPSKLLEKAFIGAYMADSSRAGISHFGMGLTIAKTNIDLMGGIITLENASSIGGACVTVKIPF